MATGYWLLAAGYCGGCMKHVQTVVPRAVAELLREAPLSPGKVRFAWSTAVGPSVQRATNIRLEGDVLFVDATSAQWAREVMRSSPLILRRLQTFLGESTVTALHVRPPASEVKLPLRRRKTLSHEP